MLDADGRPLAGAAVHLPQGLFLRPGPASGEAEPPVDAASTDAQGGFLLRGLPEGVTRHLRVEAEGHLPATVPWRSGAAALEVRLERAYTLEGRVLDAVTGEPLALAQVRATGASSASTGPAAGMGRVAADGSFRLAGLAGGAYEVRASALHPTELGPVLERARAAPPPDVVVEDVRVVAAGSRGVVLRVWAGYRLAGRVLDDAGRPVTARLVLALQGRTADGRPDPRATARVTRPEGGDTFRVDGLPAGTFDLRVEVRDGGASGLCPAEVSGVRAGRLDLELRLVRGAPLRVRLTDPQGRPLGGAGTLVYAEPEDEPEGSPAGRYGQREPDDGPVPVWRVDPLAPERGYRLLVSGVPGYARRTLGGLRPGPEVQTVVLEPTGTVEGRVLTADGAPPPRGTPVRAWAEGHEDGEPLDTTFADAEGAFRLDLGATARVVLAAGGSGSTLASAGALRGVAPGARGLLLRVVPGATLSGWLLDAEGAGVAVGALVARTGEATQTVRLPLSDATGAFALPGLPPGRVRLAYEHAGTAHDLGEHEAPATRLRLRLPSR